MSFASSAPRLHQRPSIRTSVLHIGAWAALIALLAFVLLPMYWMAKTSLTPLEDVFRFPPEFLTTEWTFGAFHRVISDPVLHGYLRNSVIVATVSAVSSVLIAAHAAYSFSKFRYPFRRSLMYLILTGQMLPQALLLITIYLVFDALGILHTYLALVLAFATFTLPLCIFMLKSYFDNIPNEIFEAAKIDGASHLKIVWLIVFPLARPGLVATGLFAFIRAWNDFIYALTLAGPGQRTLPPGLVLQYGGEFRSLWPDLMAASLMTSLPVIIAFIFLQRHFIEGLTSGAVKG